jgi:hypothetical protein
MSLALDHLKGTANAGAAAKVATKAADRRASLVFMKIPDDWMVRCLMIGWMAID